jgi:hypothetical protein
LTDCEANYGGKAILSFTNRGNPRHFVNRQKPDDWKTRLDSISHHPGSHFPKRFQSLRKTLVFKGFNCLASGPPALRFLGEFGTISLEIPARFLSESALPHRSFSAPFQSEKPLMGSQPSPAIIITQPDRFALMDE